jgi:hypothetical protein
MLHTARLTRGYLLVPTLFLLSMAMLVRGSDATGNYVALGFGLESCQTFLQARSNGLDLPYRHWLTGYLTAVNKLTKDTVDTRGTTDSDGMQWWLGHYCIKHRDHSFSRAVESLGTDLYPKRKTHMPQYKGSPEGVGASKDLEGRRHPIMCETKMASLPFSVSAILLPCLSISPSAARSSIADCRASFQRVL